MRDELSDSIDAWLELTRTQKISDDEQYNFNMTIYEGIKKLEEAGINTDELREKYNKLNGTKVNINVETKQATNALDSLLNLLDKIFNRKWDLRFDGNISSQSGYGGGGGSGHGFAKGGIAYSSLPRLASGAILNQPGKGVMYRDSIVAERGTEAILPLTDSQQMELLGETIGKYVTINANITNTMNGRIISRELQKIQAEDSFAFNR